MSDGATLMVQAAVFGDDLLAKAATPEEAIMLCGLAAARIAAKSENANPAAALHTLSVGFNSGTAIETTGKVSQPRRQTLGFAE